MASWIYTNSTVWLHGQTHEAMRQNVRYTLHHNPRMGTSWIVRHKVSGREVSKLSGNRQLAIRQWNDFLAAMQH